MSVIPGDFLIYIKNESIWCLLMDFGAISRPGWHGILHDHPVIGF
jgi:hypothetical protein